MTKIYSDVNGVLKEIYSNIKDKIRVVTLDDIVLLFSEKKKSQGIRGILKGKIRDSSLTLIREERKSWK